MRATIISESTEDQKFSFLPNLTKAKTFSGKMAAICYLKDKYFNTNASDNAKAYDRFMRVAETGHHSIADHYFVTVLFENIPKMTAMILNSLGFYNTSEKSGRYTVMNADEEDMIKYHKNYELYNKWIPMITELIKKEYPTMDDKLVEKLSLENARYMLSVFSHSTTMSYTTSFRMWSYIKCYCDRHIMTHESNYDNMTQFEKDLFDCIKELRDCIEEMYLFSNDLIENKGRGFYFLAKQTFFNTDNMKECIADAYLIKYGSSFADLAQQQRHRNIKYCMNYDGKYHQFYVPKIIKDTEYEAMWVTDLMSVAETTPIATKVPVVETGFISEFLMKCDERLCGRVQLETMNTITQNLIRFARNYGNSPFMKDMLSKYIDLDNYNEQTVKTKCCRVNCKEPCFFGAKNGITRKV